MVVHEGGVGSGFKNRDDEDSFDDDGISLFHVRGTSETNTRGVQVAEVRAIAPPHPLRRPLLRHGQSLASPNAGT